MKKNLYGPFNEEIQRYRNSLVEYAKRCEWDRFKASAGRLFDYCETVEASEIERRFMKIFGIIMFFILLWVAFIFRIQIGNSPELTGIKKILWLSAIAGGFFEFYFFLNFRIYMDYKTAFYKKRRDTFIRDIERDFRETCNLS